MGEHVNRIAAPDRPARPRLTAAATVDLDRAECLRLLASHSLGRLAISRNGPPVVRPVNYVFDERSQSIVFRSGPGSKLHSVLGAGEATFEIDGFAEDRRSGWSVIVSGRVEEIVSRAEIDRLSCLGLDPLAPGRHQFWIALRAYTVSGRRIATASKLASG
jgi:uncharacterized protein